jgi:hypothetical protein
VWCPLGAQDYEEARVQHVVKRSETSSAVG